MRHLLVTLLLLLAFGLHAKAPHDTDPSQADLSIWVNEAIVHTYTFDYKNYLADQKNIAHYFSAKAWLNYSAALTSSKLLDTIKKNLYYVSAVAQSTPQIKKRGPGVWLATMPVMVVYRNAQKEVKQTLLVTINFSVSETKTGVRGLQIESFESKVIQPACECNR
ncbi:MAG: hypothetical protein A3F18_07500 [Legionellales bacterium RIFCSPHIGHO2_12_FULL_37_14]|nr:MAG: hypothetical protein A3F18_07500 [Legionellales bacterium RIFCSPHIGHO2_12_FULL_37_14]